MTEEFQLDPAVIEEVRTRLQPEVDALAAQVTKVSNLAVAATAWGGGTVAHQVDLAHSAAQQQVETTLQGLKANLEDFLDALVEVGEAFAENDADQAAALALLQQQLLPASDGTHP